MKDFITESNYNYIIVDTMNLAARMHYGNKALSWNGKPTGMFYGVAKQALKWVRNYRNARIIFLWEGVNSKRKALNDSYKKSRTHDNDFRSLVQELKPFLDALPVEQIYHIGLEADDVAGYIASVIQPNERALLVSNDEDWFQFMRPDQIDIQRKDSIESYYDIKDSLGFPPERMGIWKILKGDASDDVSGISRFPSAVARLLCNRCKDYKQVKTYPLHKHNEAWVKWESEIRNQWDKIEQNAQMVIFNPDWIETSQIVTKVGKQNDKVLMKALLDNGIKSLAREFGYEGT